MFLTLNRLRGTDGLWSKIIGLLLALIVQIAFDNPYVSVAVGLGYIVGESFGWGLWVGNLSVHQSTNYTDDGEGANNGIQWMARKIVPDYLNNFVNYCRVALSIRGFYWWLPTLAPLYFVGFSVESLVIAIILLSVGFPLACELGYRTSRMFEFNKYGFSVSGGWEHQEVWYGLMQDIVFVGVVLCLG